MKNKEIEEPTPLAHLLVDTDERAFEEFLLAALLRDEEFYQQASRSLCIDAVTGEAVDEFGNPHDYPVYEMLKTYKAFRSILDEYRTSTGRVPDLMIVDYIDESYDATFSVAKTRDAMLAASRAIKDLAVQRGFLAVAFCQAAIAASDSPEIEPDSIGECKKALAEPADAFVGISRLMAEPGEANRGGIGHYALRQYCTVMVKGGERETVPMNTPYQFQRCEDVSREEQVARNKDQEVAVGTPGAEGKALLSIDRTAALAAVARNTEPANRGYVLLGRDRMQQLCALGNPNCLNVYIFLLLVADYRRPEKLGKSFRARQTMASVLGLTSKKIRTATKNLHDAGIIVIDSEKRPQRRGRSLDYLIKDWSESQVGANATGYFKVMRNLLDSSRRSLLGNPELLQVWIYCLAQARGLPDEEAMLSPGSFILHLGHIAQQLGASPSRVETLLGELEKEGRIRRQTADDGKTETEVVKWEVYQKWAYASDKPKDSRRSAVTGPIAQDQESILMRQANATIREMEMKDNAAALGNNDLEEGKLGANSWQTRDKLRAN
jgi:hypothetical protein